MDKLRTELAKLATNDYQGRNGSYPRCNVPDSIDVRGTNVSCDFKNTSEEKACRWLKNFLEGKGFKISGRVEAYQSGDYEDDWVTAACSVSGFNS